MKQTWLGLSSFTYPYACGINSAQRPERLLTPFQLIEKARELQVSCVQFSHNMPFDVCSDEELDHIRNHAAAHGILLENGMRCMTPERLRRYIQISDRMHVSLLRIITDGTDFEPTVEEIVSILESWMECCGTLEDTLAQEEMWARDSVAYVKSLLL